MNTLELALRNIRGNRVRSLIIFFSVLGLTLLLASTTLIAAGSRNSLRVGLAKLGADIIVVPTGAEDKVDTALLLGKPTNIRMSADYLKKVADIYGVEKVSPQIYLQSLYAASCCSVSQTFLVVFDQDTDFTISPWLKNKLGRRLAPGEIIGGSYIFIPEGQSHIKLYGRELTLAGNLEPTGTGLDQTIFMTEETARAIAQSSFTTAEQPLNIPDGDISAVMVKVRPGMDPHQVMLRINYYLPEVAAVESPRLFGAFREQISGLLNGFLGLVTIVWILGAVEISLIFFLMINDRRREIAILRALGAKRHYILRSLIYEAAFLSLAGGAAGLMSGGLGIFIFKDLIAGTLKTPFLFPSPLSTAILLLSGIVLSMLTVTLAALFPAWRIIRQDPAAAMRE